MQQVKLLGADGGDPFRLSLKHSYGRLEEEPALLEAAWREAEVIAASADQL